ncbi:MAG: hypothetical protein EBT63_06400 [Proteobacteria bacterium]|nr:hypothetical protein [Pseudomonadota bacterium]NCA29056.1 hypothetical protein [Pseudomonadota bacterium]
MTEQKELKNTKELLFDVYKRFRLGVITKEQAKCESELLTSIIKTIELDELKEQIKYLNNLLTNNKKSK